MGLVFSLLFVVLYVLFYRFSAPKSSEYIKAEFNEAGVEIFIKKAKFKNFDYRILEMQQKIDTIKPTIIFVHGSIGSARDFKKYLLDSDLQEKANLISYDRVGYGIFDTGNVQESIKFEAEMLEDLVKPFKREKLVFVGYSYGGPIILALKKKVKSIMLLAPAVYSQVEPMPWALNFYKWKLTRWLVPKTWQAASKEKLSHKQDLLNFESHWERNISSIVSVHGKSDWIVPFENSMYLKEKLSKNQFSIVPLEDAGHGLLWSNFDEIKKVILEQIN